MIPEVQQIFTSQQPEDPEVVKQNIITLLSQQPSGVFACLSAEFRANPGNAITFSGQRVTMDMLGAARQIALQRIAMGQGARRG